MRPVRLTLAACQRVVPVYADGAGPHLVEDAHGEKHLLVPPPTGHRLCGGVSIAVYRFPDGVELFACVACDAELAKESTPGAEWRLHYRQAAAL